MQLFTGNSENNPLRFLRFRFFQKSVRHIGKPEHFKNLCAVQIQRYALFEIVTLFVPYFNVFYFQHICFNGAVIAQQMRVRHVFFGQKRVASLNSEPCAAQNKLTLCGFKSVIIIFVIDISDNRNCFHVALLLSSQRSCFNFFYIADCIIFRSDIERKIICLNDASVSRISFVTHLLVFFRIITIDL